MALATLRRLLPLAHLERRARRLDLTGREAVLERSRRLRTHILGRLDPEFDVTSLAPGQLPSAVQRLMRREAAPVRAFGLRVLAVTLAAGCMFAVLIGLACAALPSARRYFFPPDLAAKAGWQLSSTFPGMPGTGFGAGGPGPLFFHTLEESNPSITLTFPRPVVVRTIEVHNREDCCQERALPLNVESVGPSGDRLLCQRRAPFQTWTCHTGGVRTQRIRIRHPGPTILHLAKIEVYE